MNDRPCQPLRVLVADDDALSRLFVRHLLEGAGHTAVVASDGLEALALLEREGFDVALLDVEMPGMGGFEVTAAVRERGIAVPIVAVTAHETLDYRAAGMDACLTKPVRARELLERLAALAADRREEECSHSR